MLVLVFSAAANASAQVRREVERAGSRDIPILPIRIEDVLPAKSLEYFLSEAHWLTATNPPSEQLLDTLVQAVLAGDTILQNTLLDLECRSRTCRVELADDNTGELAKGLPVVLLQLAATLPNAKAHANVDGAGGKTLILYLTQETPALPPPSR